MLGYYAYSIIYYWWSYALYEHGVSLGSDAFDYCKHLLGELQSRKALLVFIAILVTQSFWMQVQRNYSFNSQNRMMILFPYTIIPHSVIDPVDNRIRRKTRVPIWLISQTCNFTL